MNREDVKNAEEKSHEVDGQYDSGCSEAVVTVGNEAQNDTSYEEHYGKDI